MIIDFIKKNTAILICLSLSIFLLLPMLLPGYIFALDAVWTPSMAPIWTQDTFNNTFPFYVLINLLSFFIPAWFIEKLFLIALFFLLFYISWRFLPYIEGMYARAFAVSVFALNPLVYARLLAGQWFHLVAYALLPLLLFSLTRFTEKQDTKSTILLFGTLFLIGLFSVHFLFLGIIVSVIWLLVFTLRSIKTQGFHGLRRLVVKVMLGVVGFLALSSYWVIPALHRSAPLEARFDETYYSAFSASGNDGVPVLLNVAALGGFWGEGLAWRYYFVWPQDLFVFWGALFFILLFVVVGFIHHVKNRATRASAATLLFVGIFVYITALGASDTLFKSFNLFLYEHVPFWNGLRDSQKIAGVLALVYAVFAGIGVSVVLAKVKKHSVSAESFISVFILIIPIVFGVYMWDGAHKQLVSTDYPQGWYESKKILDGIPRNEKVLVLPWHGYLSLDFVQNKIIANPSRIFFNNNQILAGKGVEFGKIRDQEIDPEYRKIDDFVLSAENLPKNELLEKLHKENIHYIFVIKNNLVENSKLGLTRWTQYSNGLPGDPLDATHKTWSEMLQGNLDIIYQDKSVILWRISYPQ